MFAITSSTYLEIQKHVHCLKNVLHLLSVSYIFKNWQLVLVLEKGHTMELNILLPFIFLFFLKNTEHTLDVVNIHVSLLLLYITFTLCLLLSHSMYHIYN